jgi:hypothetical protein
VGRLHAGRQLSPQPVLGKSARGRRPHNVTETTFSKPNSNSSLDAIIRYVQDKYVRKLFVDPHDPIDPLKRTKSGNHNQAQLSPNHELKAKVVKTTGKQQKTNMVIGETPGGKGNPDFSVFDVMAKERPKPKAP